ANGFDKTGGTQTVNLPGIYTLTTTSNLNGCTSTSSVEVTQDIVKPNVSTLGDTLDCISGLATIVGNSTTPNVTFKWAGPSGYTSNLPAPSNVTLPGVYTLTVTAPNACTSTSTTTVAENKDTPQVTLTDPTILTCANDTVSITATILTPGATGGWTGPNNFSSTAATILVDAPGQYTYTVINPANGCKTAPFKKVEQNIEPPQAVTATGGQIDCNTPTITIKGSTTTSNVNYNWTGPGGYVSPLQSPNDVTNAGIYTLVVTNKANGCTASATANVTLDPTVPTIDVTTEVITCKKPTVTLQATTDNPTGVTWDWAGPGITAANKTVEDPVVSLPGDYVVVVKANSSGCKATFTINVKQDKALPGATAQGDTLTCLLSSLTIVSNSPTQNVEYLWAGPAGFTSTVQNPTVTLVGTYTVTITGQNGCTSTATAVVSPDKDAPVITATGGTVTCAITSIQLKATSNLPVQWLWSGPAGFSSTEQNPTTTQAGNYVLQATAANGCSVSTGTSVIANTTPPALSFGTPDELDCTTIQVNLQVTATGSGPFTYSWSTVDGTIVSGGTSPAPTVSEAAPYVVVVTNTSNGCTSTGEVTVLADPATPSGVATLNRDVSCFGDTNGAIVIDSVQGGTAPFLFSLDNSPFSPQTSFTALPPGPHVLMIQDANGCEFESTIEIKEPEELLVNLGPDTTIHLGDHILLDTSNIVNFPDRVKTLLVKPSEYVQGDTLFPKHSFRYTATVIDENGCKATDDRVVIVDKTRLVYIPNVIYPESSKGNEIMRISVGQDVENIKAFQIYDRWGSLVYEKRNFLPVDPNNEGWDGTAKGDRATPAVFVYYAEILFKDGETEIFKGDVTVYR
ncbi:MAG TPA: gliding motility-associated C-terminal domain-containing protein, partial [Saprospiraceae bacterium]|nr:gliding motility-associated C-terminal domain-containing protein [Saprospiraceae bacterium]